MPTRIQEYPLCRRESRSTLCAGRDPGFPPGNPGVPFHQSTLARALDRPGKKRKGPEEVGTCVYKVEKGGWGSRRPEEAIFLPEAARRFHAEPVSDKERGKTGVVCVLSHGQEGIITRSCRLSENSDSESEETVGKTLALLGRILRVTIVKSAAAGFGAARQSVQNLVDFESIVLNPRN